MKTKIALAAAAKKTPEQVQKDRAKWFADTFKSMFGKPSKSKADAEMQNYDWEGAAIQLYIYANGTFGVFIDQPDYPSIEFDVISYASAIKKLAAWGKKAEAATEKKMAQLDKQRVNFKSFASAFAN